MSSLSDTIREQGNAEFKSRRYRDSILSYNRALTKAGNDEDKIALCYANRSAAFMQLGYYTQCLHNIELAEANYPREKLSKLHERREKCLKLMSSQCRTVEAPRNPFEKLTYDVNPKLPFFINDLEMRENSQFGKHLVTTRNLMAGDVIAVINQHVIVPTVKAIDFVSLCYNCLKTNDLDLIVTGGGCEALVCSEACKLNHMRNQNSHSIYHEMESKGFHQRLIFTAKVFMDFIEHFGGLPQMMELFKSEQNKTYSVFDFDWSKPNDPLFIKNTFLVLMGMKFTESSTLNDLKILTNGVEGIGLWLLTTLSKENEMRKIFDEHYFRNNKLIEKILMKIFAVFPFANEVTVAPEEQELKDVTAAHGHFLHPCSLILNHSCDPNITFHIADHERVVWIVNQPIPAGGQIFKCYSPTYWPYYSVLTTPSSCEFKESCVVCKNDWKRSMSGNTVTNDAGNSFLTIFNGPEIRNKMFTASVNRFGMACKFINENFSNYNESSETRKKIVTKIHEIGMLLEVIENPPSDEF